VRFPRDMYTADDEFLPSRRIIRDLLEPSVLKRLGCQKRGMLDIKDAEFFAGVSHPAANAIHAHMLPTPSTGPAGRGLHSLGCGGNRGCCCCRDPYCRQ
jgi:hypothetical protein